MADSGSPNRFRGKETAKLELSLNNMSIGHNSNSPIKESPVVQVQDWGNGWKMVMKHKEDMDRTIMDLDDKLNLVLAK